MRNRHHSRSKVIALSISQARRRRGWHLMKWIAILLTLLALWLIGNAYVSFAVDVSIGKIAPTSGPDVSQKIREHIEFGEFATAIELAKSIKEPIARHAALEKASLAQANSGAKRQAINTALEVDDDELRYSILKQLKKVADERSGDLDKIIATRNTDRALGLPGGSAPDFESLIALITNTVQPKTWQENGGGEGTIDRYQGGGVFCDPDGVLKKKEGADSSDRLQKMHDEVNRQLSANNSAKRYSPLRKISLVRLEAAVQRSIALNEPLPDEVRLLAGLERIQYLFISAEENDIIIAGPAGEWQKDDEGRYVTVQNQLPVVLLDDMIVVLRHVMSEKYATFGCSITPVQERLAATQQYLDETSKSPLKPGVKARKDWFNGIRTTLGKQKIEINGLDGRTHAARVLVEADYRMKLVGIGLEPGVVGMKNYLDSVASDANGSSMPMDVLRWWFAMNYDSIVASKDRLAFELRGQGVQVLCENELLNQAGERVHTGAANDLNVAFTRSFTKHFPELCKKYPIYAELRNLFDIAIVGALIKSEQAAKSADWSMTCFGREGDYVPQSAVAPQWVDSVVNHRVVNKTQIVAGVSGGVSVEPYQYVGKNRLADDSQGIVAGQKKLQERYRPNGRGRWWWD